jgi:hypothetical protein
MLEKWMKSLITYINELNDILNRKIRGHNMSKRYETELIKVLDKLPEEKAIELIDFGKFLLSQYPGTSKSQIDESSLLLQQKSLSKIWDDSEENVYDL